jgi:electron transfer flavoprotein beta subunit
VRILVCIKEIQNPEIAASVFRVDEARKEVIPLDGLPLVTSPFDEQAIEAALRIRDRGQECRITVLSLGPASAKAAIKRALSMGADDAIHVLDTGLEQASSATVAQVLARVAERSGPFDLILAGRQAADWDAGIVGCGIAELLRIPVVTFARSVELVGSRVVVERMVDDGTETVEAPLPCVVTISNELGEPRKATLKETMRAAKKPIEAATAESLGMEGTKLRAEQERTQVRERLYVPRKESKCDLITGVSADEIARQAISKLAASKLI